MSERKGYRGYVFSRPIGRDRVAQHIQNLVIRNFASQHDFSYKLSATEYQMPNSYMMLQQVIDEASMLEGVILYSMFMLSDDATERYDVYAKILEAGAGLYGAAEGIAMENESHIKLWENIFITRNVVDDIDYKEVEKWLM